MPELTVFVNVFFRNENVIANYYESVRDLIGSHVVIFLINNVSEDFLVDQLTSLGKVVYVADVICQSLPQGAAGFMTKPNARYVRHFFAGVTSCDTKYFTFFDPDNMCEDYRWIDEAKNNLKKDNSIAVVCPAWEKKNASYRYFLDSGFSDQLFVGLTDEFKNFDYTVDSVFSWMYPLRQNGPTFESAVFSNMMKKRLRRQVLCDYYYFHENEGFSYAKRNLLHDSKRFLARTTWNIRSVILRDKHYG